MKNKLLRGTPAYFTKVKKILLGKKKLDFLQLNLEPICNYRCSKCFMGLQGKRQPVKTFPMSITEIFRILEDARRLGAKVLAISGEGEPLLNPKFRQIISFAHDIGFVPFIATNGSCLDYETAAFLLDSNASITVSLDTLDRKKYEQGCNISGSFDKLMQNLEDIRQLFKDAILEEAGHTVMRCGIHAVIEHSDPREIQKLIHFVGEEFFLSIGTVAAGVNNTLDAEQVSKELLLPAELSAPLLGTKTDRGNICGFFYYGLALSFDGNILLDAHAIESSGLLGNVKEMKLEHALEQVQQLKTEFCKGTDSYCVVRASNYHTFLEFLRNGYEK